MKYFTESEEKEIITFIKRLTTEKILFNNYEIIVDLYSNKYETTLKELISKDLRFVGKYILSNFDIFVTGKYTLHIEELCSKSLINKIKSGIPETEIKKWSNIILNIINFKEFHIKEDRQILFNIIDALIEEYITLTKALYYGFDFNKLIKNDKIIFYSFWN